LLPIIIQAVLEGAVLIIKSLAAALPTLIPQLISAILDSILTILDYIDVIIDAGIELLVALFEGLNDPDMIVKLVETIPMIILKLVEAIIINLPKIITATFKIIETMANSIIAALPKLKEKLPEIGKSILRELSNLPGKMAEVGGNLIRGLWNGLGSSIDWIIGKIKGFGKSVMKAIKGIFGVHSPSTEWEFVGKMNMLGFEKGIEEMQPQIQDTIDSAFNLQPYVSGNMSSTYSPNVVVNVENNMELDPLGQLVSNIKTFSGGAKNDYNWGAGV
jgi:phage-related protein